MPVQAAVGAWPEAARPARRLHGSPGEVAEWSKANDSKSFEGQPSVGSNPTLSVSKGSSKGLVRPDPLLYLGFWRVDRPGQSVALSLDLAPKIATALDCGIEDLLEEVEG